MISENTINKVKSLDVAEVLGHYVTLQRKGAALVCCCPFHGERTPSFSVTPSKNVWHCFGCGKGGDAIAFVMEHERLQFSEAVEAIAKKCGIPVEYVSGERSEEEKALSQKRETMLLALEAVQDYYTGQLAKDQTAQAYAYRRWPKEFCDKVGIGYAPLHSFVADYCDGRGVSTDTLTELGVLKAGDHDSLYPVMRQRITIPIRNRWGKVIGFTARYIGDRTDTAKYFNSPTSDLFHKDEAVFGIDLAVKAVKDSGFLILVEGAPDVLRLQSVGLANAVAPLGTAWTDLHFDTLKQLTHSLCFIPDADVPKDGSAYGPGITAVIANGKTAVSHGFDVTVREIPQGDEKNDPDSYIHSAQDFFNLEEKHFAVWLAGKLFPQATTLVKTRETVNQIARLLSATADKMVLDECIEQLSHIHGRPKMWRDAVAALKNAERAESRTKKGEGKADAEPTMKELLKKFNLFVRDNMYYSAAEDEPVRLSNFILEPMYHIKDDSNGTRIFRIVNEYGQEEVVEFREAELVSLSNFQQKVGSLGNYIWKAKIDKLNVVKELLYTLTDSAELVKQMGWDAANGFYAFGNGILKDGQFLKVDDLGIVRLDRSRKYYIPATSMMYRNNPAVFQFERLFQHENRSAVTLHDFADKVIDVFGDNGKVGLCYLFASLFRDIIYPIKNCFPMLNLFGLKGTGKTSLATTLQSFFIHGIDPPSISISSIPSMNDRVSQVNDALVVFDEYKNDIDERKIAYLKALWGGTGQVKKNMSGDGKASHTVVTAAVCICGQDLPTRDIALYSRVIHLTFTRPSFTMDERRRFDELKEMSNLGNTHLAIQVLNLRKVMEGHYRANHSLVRKELSNALADEEIEDRVLDNWVVPLATLRTLETSLCLPFTYADLFRITLAGIRYQNEGCKKNTEMAEFWEVIDSLHSQGRIIEKAHFRIRYMTSFRAIGRSEPTVFAKAKPVLFINASAVASLYTGRIAGGSVVNKSGNWATVITYLKVQPSFLGLKQDRFNLLLPNGMFDYVIETIGGRQERRIKVNRPKALCFDYEMLKNKYSINLETTAVSEAEFESDADIADPPPRQGQLAFQ